MNEKDLHKHFVLLIETLSPLHIGSGEQVNGRGEYFATPKRIIFPNYEKLMGAIGEENLKEYVNYVLQSGVDTNTFDKLKDWGITIENMTIERELPLNSGENLTNRNDLLHLHIKMGDNPLAPNKVYLPGSTLKGAIRNALIYDFLVKNNELLSGVQQQFREALGVTNKSEKEEKAKNSKNSTNDLRNLANLLGQTTPQKGNPKRNIIKIWSETEKNSIISDKFANTIRIVDSQELPDLSLIVEQVVRYSFTNDTNSGLDYLLECIETGAKIFMQISIYLPKLVQNKQMLHWSKIEDLYNAINNFSKANLEFEKKQIDASSLKDEVKNDVKKQIEQLISLIDASNNDYAIIRLGKGKTKLFQTILLALDEDLRIKILRLFKKEEVEPLPQTRVITANGNHLLGWVKMQGSSL